MELRTRILPKMLNSEVEAYLEHNDIIIVPVGTVEMHGGFPLDSETVISEAYALKMAEACDGLALTGLPYFYRPQPAAPGVQTAGLHQLPRPGPYDLQPDGP